MADSGSKAGPKTASDEDDVISTDGSAPQSMTLSSDEVNFLVYRYLQENGASTRICTSAKYQAHAKGGPRDVLWLKVAYKCCFDSFFVSFYNIISLYHYLLEFCLILHLYSCVF